MSSARQAIWAPGDQPAGARRQRLGREPMAWRSASTVVPDQIEGVDVKTGRWAAGGISLVAGGIPYGDRKLIAGRASRDEISDAIARQNQALMLCGGVSTHPQARAGIWRMG